MIPPDTTLATASSDTNPNSNDNTNTRRGSSASRSSPRKRGVRHRQERPAEEGIKFNVGPKSLHAMLARRVVRRTRPERVTEPYTMGVPDYPPPSFQEAISSSRFPILPTTPQGEETPQAQEQHTRSSDQGDADINVQRHRSSSDSDSSSEESPNVVGTRDDVPRDSRHGDEDETENQRGLTFPSTLPRGRTETREAVDDGDSAEDAQVAQLHHSTLSPLRPLYPSLYHALHDRSTPAMEPISSSYPHFQNMSFFRSTSSLRLQNASGNATTTIKATSSMNSQQTSAPRRGLLSRFQRKDRAERSERPQKVEIDPDTDELDIWEVIDSGESEGDEEMKAKREKSKVPIPFIERVPPRFPQQTPTFPPAAPPHAPQLHEHLLHPTPIKFPNGGGPDVTAVRQRQTNEPPQLSITQKFHVFNASPLVNQWQVDEVSPAMTTATASEVVFDPTFESALETPLPPSPTEELPRSGTPPLAGYSSEFRSAIADMAGLQGTLSTDPFATDPDTGLWAETQTKKHYAGRPLPVAPGFSSRTQMDQRYLPLTPPPDSEKNREGWGDEEMSCPEAPFTDLNDNAPVAAATSHVDLRVLSTPSTLGTPPAGHLRRPLPVAPAPSGVDVRMAEKDNGKERGNAEQISPVSEDIPIPELFKDQPDTAPTTPTSPLSPSLHSTLHHRAASVIEPTSPQTGHTETSEVVVGDDPLESDPHAVKLDDCDSVEASGPSAPFFLSSLFALFFFFFFKD